MSTKNEIDKRPNTRMKYSERKEYLKSIEKLKEKYANEIIGEDTIKELSFIEE